MVGRQGRSPTIFDVRREVGATLHKTIKRATTMRLLEAMLKWAGIAVAVGRLRAVGVPGGGPACAGGGFDTGPLNPPARSARYYTVPAAGGRLDRGRAMFCELPYEMMRNS